MNIGDGLARWTDGLLKSTYHRVRAPKITDDKVWKGVAKFCHPAVGICCLQASCFLGLSCAGAKVFNPLLCQPQAEHYHSGQSHLLTATWAYLLLLHTVLKLEEGYISLLCKTKNAAGTLTDCKMLFSFTVLFTQNSDELAALLHVWINH